MAYGTDGDDRMSGQVYDGRTQLYGFAGNDNMTLRGSGSLSGGRGNDVLTGGNDDDYLQGGPGDDYLDGGDGDDSATGGRGSDTCVNSEQVTGCSP